MANTTVTSEALIKMAEMLRQSAEEIMASKVEMDSQLRSFIWDDPTGYYFTEKYEEDFKPLTDRLIPTINDYVSYIARLEGNVAEYIGVAALLGGLAPNGLGVPGKSNHSGSNPNTPPPVGNAGDDKRKEPQGATPKKRELKIGERIVVDDMSFIVEPIVNGCGTKEGFGRWAGQRGAGLDAFMNSSKAGPVIVATAALTTGIQGLVTLSKIGEKMYPEEFNRIEREACDPHDKCYFVERDRQICESNFQKNGGRISSLFTTVFGGRPHKIAQNEASDSEDYKNLIEKGTGINLIIPENCYLKKL